MNKFGGFIAALTIGATSAGCMPEQQVRVNPRLEAIQTALDASRAEREQAEVALDDAERRFAKDKQKLADTKKALEEKLKKQEETLDVLVNTQIDLIRRELYKFLQKCDVRAIRKVRSSGTCSLSAWKHQMNKNVDDGSLPVDRIAEIWDDVNTTIDLIRRGKNLSKEEVELRAQMYARNFVKGNRGTDVEAWMEHVDYEMTMSGISRRDILKVLSQMSRVLEMKTMVGDHFEKSSPKSPAAKEPEYY